MARCVARHGLRALEALYAPNSVTNACSQLSRGYAQAAGSPSIILVRMPKLIPTMTSGMVTKWHVKEGSEIVEVDLAFSVKMKLVSEREARKGSTEGMDSQTAQVGQMQNLDDTPQEGSTLDIECHEDGVLAKILVQEGEEAPVDAPVAVICEAEDLEAVQEMVKSGADLASSSERDAAWQAFISSQS